MVLLDTLTAIDNMPVIQAQMCSRYPKAGYGRLLANPNSRFSIRQGYLAGLVAVARLG